MSRVDFDPRVVETVAERADELYLFVAEQMGTMALAGAAEADQEAALAAAEILHGAAELLEEAVLRQPPVETKDDTLIDLAEEETYQIFSNFVIRKKSTTFTISELKQHLKIYGVDISSDSRLRRMFPNWCDDLLGDSAEAGKRVRWVTLDQEKVKKYALSEIVSRDQFGKTQSVPRVSMAQPAGLSVAKPQPVAKPALSDRAFNLLESMPDTKAKRVIEQFADSQNISLAEAHAAFTALIDDGRIHKHRPDGSLVFSFEAPTDKQQNKPQSEQEKSRLTERQKEIAKDIVLFMAGPRKYASRRYTPLELHRELSEEKGEPVSNPDELKLIARALIVQNLLTSGAPAGEKLSARGSKVFKISIAGQEVFELLRSDAVRNKILANIDSGIPLDVAKLDTSSIA